MLNKLANWIYKILCKSLHLESKLQESVWEKLKASFVAAVIQKSVSHSRAGCLCIFYQIYLLRTMNSEHLLPSEMVNTSIFCLNKFSGVRSVREAWCLMTQITVFCSLCECQSVISSSCFPFRLDIQVIDLKVTKAAPDKSPHRKQPAGLWPLYFYVLYSLHCFNRILSHGYRNNARQTRTCRNIFKVRKRREFVWREEPRDH